MTKTAVIVLSEEGILIVAIPPLSHHPPEFFGDNHTLPTLMPPPLFRIKFPGGSELRIRRDDEWRMVSPWYFGSSHHLYFDMLSNNVSEKRHRFKIELEPDLSTASLHAIYNPGLTRVDVATFFQGYMICEDTLVSFWLYDHDHDDEFQNCELYTESTSTFLDNAISHSGPAVKMLLPDIGRDLEYILYPSPASGRFIRQDENNSVAVLDFF